MVHLPIRPYAPLGGSSPLAFDTAASWLDGPGATPLNVPEVREYARTLKNVVHVQDNLYTCSQDTQGKIKDAIIEHKLNRVIVASCSPRPHEPMFRETCREAGINKYLFEMANIRDQCSWVHMRQKGEATLKAKDLVRMAVANARLIRPLTELGLPVIQKGLVIGGGVAGMTAALKLAEQGYEIFLLEKEAQLGGNLRNLHYTLEGQDVQAFLRDLINRRPSSRWRRASASERIRS